MKKNARKPGLVQIIWVDSQTKGFIAFVIITWIVRAVVPTISSITIPIAPFATLVCVFLLIWRIRYIQDLFSHGNEVTGTITLILPSRGGRWVAYHYNYQRHQYSATGSVPYWHRELRVGDTIRLIVDPQTPKKVFIRDVFFW